jgi:ADP-ribose pyrophosphatase
MGLMHEHNAENTMQRYLSARFQRTPYSENSRFLVLDETITFDDESKKHYTLVLHRGAVAIIPIIEDSVIFVRQYRHAVKEITIEWPAGLIDENESYQMAANRELMEETGYKANKLTYLKKIYSTPGFTNEAIHLFLGEELEKSPKTGDDTHEIDCVKVPVATAISDEFMNTILDAKTLIGLYTLRSHVQKLS